VLLLGCQLKGSSKDHAGVGACFRKWDCLISTVVTPLLHVWHSLLAACLTCMHAAGPPLQSAVPSPSTPPTRIGIQQANLVGRHTESMLSYTPVPACLYFSATHLS
jgi:hypothetical protein